MKIYTQLILAGLLAVSFLLIPTVSADSQLGIETQNSMTVSQGATITVTLSENPSTGYTWTMNASSGLELVKDEYTKLENDRFGAEGSHEWVYLAVTPGLQKVRGEYKRPFEEGSARDYLLTVLVVAKSDTGGSYIYIPTTPVPTVTPVVTLTTSPTPSPTRASTAAELIKKFQSDEKKITFPLVRPSGWPFIILHK